MKLSEKQKTTKSFKQVFIFPRVFLNTKLFNTLNSLKTAMIISFTKKISSVALLLCCLSLDFVLLKFFETMPHEAKRGNLEVYICASLSHCGSFRIGSAQTPATVWTTLVVVCPDSLAGLVFSSTFNHSSWLQCDPWFVLDAEPVGSIRFLPLWCLWRQKWATQDFLHFCPNASTCDEKNRLTTVRSHVQMKYHTAIRFIRDNWWGWISLKCQHAI